MIDFTKATWICEPQKYEITTEKVVITTEPETDLWQRSFYGFRNDNAPSLLVKSSDNFTFTTRVDFEYKELFDQCGVIVYFDSDNWFKASIEFENSEFSRIGSVVTNMGYSDWATTDITLPAFVWYRLSRRGADFLIESSFDGITFNQVRIFHLHKLGETTQEMGRSNPPLPVEQPVRFGLYACSPLKSSFTATFTDMKLEACKWVAHSV
ncbi:MAG: DUF1349 domain-containing protein [Spirochaetaceae bacterium]